jgi:hypothetical protein
MKAASEHDIGLRYDLLVMDRGNTLSAGPFLQGECDVEDQQRNAPVFPVSSGYQSPDALLDEIRSTVDLLKELKSLLIDLSRKKEVAGDGAIDTK